MFYYGMNYGFLWMNYGLNHPFLVQIIMSELCFFMDVIMFYYVLLCFIMFYYV